MQVTDRPRPDAPSLTQTIMDLMHHWQPCFRTVSAILIVLSTVVAKDAISSFHVQPDPSTDSLSSISLLGLLLLLLSTPPSSQGRLL